MCTPESPTSRAIRLLESTWSVLNTVLMFAVPTCGPIGCPVSPPPLSSQNIQSHEKSPTSRRAQGETQIISLAQDANPGGRERVKVKASRIQNIRIGSALVCVRRNVQHRELKLPESTWFMPVTVEMAAVFTSGPIGCLLIVSTHPLQPKNVQSREKAPANHGARGEPPTMSFVPGANREGMERVKGEASRIQSSRIGSVLVCVRRNAQLRELKLLESTRFVLSTIVMIAASTGGPTGCLVCPPPLSPQNIQPHEQSPAGRGAWCGTAHRLLLATAVSIATIPGAGIGWRKSS